MSNVNIIPLRFVCCLPMVLLCPGAQALVHAQERYVSGPVNIALRPQAVSDDALILLDQVAEITGGGSALRARIAKMDIADFKLDAEHAMVTQEQVRYRLLLAGIDASRFRLLGARRTIVVASDEPITRRRLLAAADHKLREKYPGDISSVTISPSSGILVPSIRTTAGDQVRLEAKIRPGTNYAGRVRVDVSIVVNGKTREVVGVPMEISAPDEEESTTAPVGQHARPSTPLPFAGIKKDIVIKSHENVRIITQIGSARIEATAEAMDDGCVGQIIHVRNLESNRIVSGRVEGAGIVKVEY